MGRARCTVRPRGFPSPRGRGMAQSKMSTVSRSRHGGYANESLENPADFRPRRRRAGGRGGCIGPTYKRGRARLVRSAHRRDHPALVRRSAQLEWLGTLVRLPWLLARQPNRLLLRRTGFVGCGVLGLAVLLRLRTLIITPHRHLPRHRALSGVLPGPREWVRDHRPPPPPG